MQASVKPARFLAAVLGLALITSFRPADLTATPDPLKKLDPVLKEKARHREGYSRVIIHTDPAHSRKDILQLIRAVGGVVGRRLPAMAAQVAFVPTDALAALAASPIVARVSDDRLVLGSMERTAATIGALPVRLSLGVD